MTSPASYKYHRNFVLNSGNTDESLAARGKFLSQFIFVMGFKIGLEGMEAALCYSYIGYD